MLPHHVTRFLVSAIFVLVFAPLPRYEVDALFFGSNSEKKEEEHKINEASDEAKDLVREFLSCRKRVVGWSVRVNICL